MLFKDKLVNLEKNSCFDFDNDIIDKNNLLCFNCFYMYE